MMNELRWILVGASIVLLVWIYWQGRRKNLATAEPSVRREFDPPQLGDVAVVRERPVQPEIIARPTLDDDDLPEVRISSPSLSMDAALSTSALEKLTLTQPLKAT